MHRSGNHAFQLLAVRDEEVSVRRLLELRIEMRIPEFDLKLAFPGVPGKRHLKVVFAFCELVPETIEAVRWTVRDAAKYGHLDIVKFLLLYNSRQYAQKSKMVEGTRNAPTSQDDQGATISASTDQDRLQNSCCQLYVFDQDEAWQGANTSL